MINLLKDKTKIVGKRVYLNGSVVKDENTKQIESLIKDYLKTIATDESGWDTLYQNPDDNKFWELTYLQSELHGGGPPCLSILSEEEARKKYSLK